MNSGGAPGLPHPPSGRIRSPDPAPRQFFYAEERCRSFSRTSQWSAKKSTRSRRAKMCALRPVVILSILFPVAGVEVARERLRIVDFPAGVVLLIDSSPEFRRSTAWTRSPLRHRARRRGDRRQGRRAKPRHQPHPTLCGKRPSRGRGRRHPVKTLGRDRPWTAGAGDSRDGASEQLHQGSRLKGGDSAFATGPWWR